MKKGKYRSERSAGAAFARLRRVPACLTEEEHVEQSVRWVVERVYKSGRLDGRADLMPLARFGWLALNARLGRLLQDNLDAEAGALGLVEKHGDGLAAPELRISREAWDLALKLKP